MRRHVIMSGNLDKYAAIVASKSGWLLEDAKTQMLDARNRIKVSFRDYSRANLWKVPVEQQNEKWEYIQQKRENKKILVVVLTRNYSTGLSVIRSLGAAGFVVDAIGSSKKKGDSALLAESKYVRNHVEVISRKLDGIENPELLDILLSYESDSFEEKILFPTDDYTTSIINFYADELKDIFIFPSITDDNGMDYYMNKGVQCNIAENAGIKAPKTFNISLREKPLVLPQGITYPCFCKPVSSYKGMKTEMKKCDSKEELLLHLQKVQADFSDREFLIQDYIDVEYEMAVEGYSCKGKVVVPGVVRKETVAQWETGVSITGKFLDIKEYAGLKKQVRRLMKSIPYDGLFDIDLMYSNGNIYFTELNFRSGGLTYVFVKNGVNLPALFVRDFVGLDHLKKQEVPKTYDTHFIYEKMAWEDVIHGYMTKRELKALKKSVDFGIMDDQNDKRPYRKYVESINVRYEKIDTNIHVKSNYYNLDSKDINTVWEVSHQAKWSWDKAQREMQCAKDILGIQYDDYLRHQLWRKNFGEDLYNMGLISIDDGTDYSKINLEYYQERLAKIIMCKNKEDERNTLFKRSITDDRAFKSGSFRHLNEEERQEVKKYWKQYSFAVPAPMNACRVYTNCSGIFSPYYISNAMIKDVYKWSCPETYRIALQNKSYTAKLFSHARTPKTVIRNVSGISLDANWNEITIDHAVELCDAYMRENKELVIKATSAAGGGTAVSFLSKLNKEELKELLTKRSDYLIQELIIQHDVLNSFNPTSVNTLRLTTLYFDNKIDLLACLIRVGVTGSRLDNHVQGGTLVGVTKEGKTLEWALTGANDKIEVLPSGLELKNGIVVPYYDEAVNLVKNCHKEIAMVKIVSWDVAITPDGPMIVECNFGGDLRMHQAVTGPVFGDATNSIMSVVYGKKFYKDKSDFNYDYHEFCKAATICNYANNEEEVFVPSTFNKKKIVRICSKSFFRKHNMKRVVIPEGVKWIDSEAFRGCDNLEEVVLPSTLIQIGKRAFMNCHKLSKINLDSKVIVHNTAFESCECLNRTSL